MILFYILVLSLPFVELGPLASAAGGITGEKFLGMATFLYAIFYLPRKRQLLRPFETGQARAFIAFALLAVISYLFQAARFEWLGMFGIVFLQVFLFLITLVLVDTRERLQNTLLAFVASTGLLSAYCIREWVGMVQVYGLGYRPGWVAGDANMLAISVLLGLPLTLSFALGLPMGTKRVLCIGALISSGIAILLSASRGGLLGLAVVLALQVRDRRFRTKMILLGVLLLVAVMVSPVSPLGRLLNPTSSDTESSEWRLAMWSASARMIADHPIFGVGFRNFAPYLRKYAPEIPFHVPHNTFLEITVELGAVGLLLFIAMVVAAFRNLYRLRKAAEKAGDPLLYSVSINLGNALVGFIVTASFISAMHAKLFWFTIFLSTCLPRLLLDRVKSTREELPRYVMPGAAIHPALLPIPTSDSMAVAATRQTRTAAERLAELAAPFAEAAVKPSHRAEDRGPQQPKLIWPEDQRSADQATPPARENNRW